MLFLMQKPCGSILRKACFIKIDENYTLLSSRISMRVSQSPKTKIRKLPMEDSPKLIEPTGIQNQPRHNPTR